MEPYNGIKLPDLPDPKNKGRFHSGTRFRGNVNGVEMEVISVEQGIAKIRNIKTGMVSYYGVQALEHCDLEVTGWRQKSV